MLSRANNVDIIITLHYGYPLDYCYSLNTKQIITKRSVTQETTAHENILTVRVMPSKWLE